MSRRRRPPVVGKAFRRTTCYLRVGSKRYPMTITEAVMLMNGPFPEGRIVLSGHMPRKVR